MMVVVIIVGNKAILVKDLAKCHLQAGQRHAAAFLSVLGYLLTEASSGVQRQV